MLRIGLAGIGKMGVSHLAILNAHPGVEVVAVCDPLEPVLKILNRYTGLKYYIDYSSMLHDEKLDAVFIATPTRLHAEMTEAALERGLHVYCEKPLSLEVEDGRRMVRLAEERGLISQVGYHYRFVAAFRELKRVIDEGWLGRITHIRSEAYGGVVLRPKGSTWRAKRSHGGGCLYDYASHAIDLTNYLVGRPDAVGGTILNKVFSDDVEDEVYSNLFWDDGRSGSIAANWSDASHRKMSTQVTVWGTCGRATAERQEVRLYLRNDPGKEAGMSQGWNVRYTTELTEEVGFYLRGEEYSSQIDHFVQCVEKGVGSTMSSFRSALETDEVVAMMLEDARKPRQDRIAASTASAGRPGSFSWSVRNFLR